MNARSLSVTDTELDVLKALWDHGPSTIRQLTDRLYPGGSTAHYATVQKLLERLRAKSCVSRRPDGRVNVYEASRARAELIASQLQATADKLCEGSLTPLLTHLVRSRDLGPRELKQLRELVRRLEEER